MFSLMSLLPFAILASAFFFFVYSGRVEVDLDLLFWVVLIVGVFAFIGFISMRKTFVSLMKVTSSVKEILSGDLSKRINIKGGSNEITELARSFNQVVQQLEHNVKELEKSRNMLQSVLMRVSSGASSAENIDAFLDLILETTVDALGGLRGLLLLIDEESKQLVVKSSSGLGERYAKDARIPIDEEVVGWVIKQKKPLLIPRLSKSGAAQGVSEAFEPPLICTPLIFQGRIIGASCISGKKEGDSFDEDEMIVLSNLSSQVALATENARLNADNQKTYLETVTALALAVEARDLYSRGHSDRVSEYAVMIAQILKLSEAQINTIRAAAQLHDVGKIGISDEILRKPAALDEYERKIIQQHPAIGEGIIVPLHGFSNLRDPIRHHHEWLNGEGYPDHLKGDEISLEARILTVCDCYDAMTTDRPYRKGMDKQQAKDELLRYANVRYDPKVVDALIQALGL